MGSFSDDQIEVEQAPSINELAEKSSVELMKILFDRKQEIDDRFDAAVALRKQTDKSDAVMDMLFNKVVESTRPVGAGHDPAGEAFQIQKTGKMAAIALQDHWIGSEKITAEVKEWVVAGVASIRQETALTQAYEMRVKQIRGNSKLWLPESAREKIPPAYNEQQDRLFREDYLKFTRALTIISGSEADVASALINHVLRERMRDDADRIFALNAAAGNDSPLIQQSLILMITDQKTSSFIQDYILNLLEAYCPNGDKFRESLGEIRDFFSQAANRVDIDMATESDLISLSKRFDKILENASTPERKNAAIEQYSYHPWRILMHMEDPRGKLSTVPGSNVFYETRPDGTIADLSFSKKIRV